jgi:hypothetical protein
MLRTLLCALLWLAVAFHGDASASNDADAKAFLEEVVRSDFAGDASPRIGHVIRNRRASEKEDPTWGPAPEAYVLDGDPLVVVTDWKRVAIEKKAANVCAKFSFTVVAATAGEGLPSWESTTARHIRALPKSRSDTVTYCARFRHGNWMLIDAPLPRVSKEGLISFMQERSARSEEIVSKLRSADPRAVENARRVSESLKEQLAVLLSL